MNDKPTHKSQDALSTAVQRAAADGSPQVEPLHLLLALVEQARRLIAELHAEVAQLRVELESTRAVAARLAELRRSGSNTRSGGEGREGLVPVRSARVAVWEPIAGPAGESGPPRGDK